MCTGDNNAGIFDPFISRLVSQENSDKIIIDYFLNYLITIQGVYTVLDEMR
jgi:hypothetical protein